MILYPYMNLFIFTLISSTIMAISSCHWLMIWMALELNMISFIPIISSSNWFQESEATLKYILFQALGSSFLLLGIMNPSWFFMITLGLIMKLGAAPFHFWFPPTMKSISWPSATVLMTWQKVAPMFLLIMNLPPSSGKMLMLLGAFGALLGGVGGMLQSTIRPMLAYSSIGHMGWMIAVAPVSPSISLLYLIFYILISIPIMWSAYISNINSLKTSKAPVPTLAPMLLLPNILSLSGLPPLLGFIPKLMSILSFPLFIIPIILIVGSLINLSYYLNFFFSLSMSSYSKKKERLPLSPPLTLSAITWLACSPFPAIYVVLAMV
uniref:NADH-ubiquinone oxidoreductase chain 2 n=1 Tax=Prionospio plumosa TaxID=3050096 RepID=A0AAU6QH23_9ANNE